MKLEDFVYAVLQKAFSELEHHHHFVVPEPMQKAVIAKVQSEISEIVKDGSPREKKDVTRKRP